MELNTILYPVLSIGGMGLLFGLGLGYAGRIFHVEEDPKIVEIRDVLPGANCGGCGFPGCDGFSNAVAKGDAPVNGCPVGGSETAARVAKIMGLEAGDAARTAAYIKCAGSCEKAVFRYDYYGLDDCKAVSMLAGTGSKSCAYGCLGNGSCVRACPFHAIQIVDGIAVIDSEKCTSCKKCIGVCPRKLIEIVPVEMNIRVGCNSLDNGKVVRGNCSVGCISCKMCEKACQYDAVHINNLLAKVDYDKCVKCGACVAKCPTKAIREINGNLNGEIAEAREKKAE